MNYIKELIASWIRAILSLFIKQKIDELVKESKKPEDLGFNVTIQESPDSPIAEDSAYILSSEILNEFDFQEVMLPDIKNNDKHKSILIVDDVEFTSILYQSDFSKIKDKYNLDIESDYKIVNCLGPTAGYSAYRYAILENNKIDIAIIDITLGYRVNIAGKYYAEIDGIDLAYHLVNKYPNIRFIMCTAHTLNLNNSSVKRYYSKMLNNLGFKLDEKYLNKNDDRVDKLYNLITGE